MNNELRSKIELAADNWIRQEAALKALIEPGDLPAELSRELEREADMLRKCAEEIKRLLGTPTGQWTTQAPTEPGYYWYEENGVKVVTRVQICNEHELGVGRRSYLVAGYRGLSSFPVIKMEGTWFSEPLNVPGPNNR